MNFNTPATENDHQSGDGDSDGEEVFHDARFPADEEAKLLSESHAQKAEANSLFASACYSDAISTYDHALASCPNYLDYEIAVLRSNIAACYLKLEDWKTAVDTATACIESLNRCLPASTQPDRGGDGQTDAQAAVVELSGQDEEAEQKELQRLEQDDKRKEDVKRIRTKALMRRARARVELAGWANLQGAEDDYKELSAMDSLPSQDRKFVQRALGELPQKVQNAREKEMGEMMGKLKDLGNGILKPFGLSTDNFKLQKDENTGGYSMQFQSGS